LAGECAAFESDDRWVRVFQERLVWEFWGPSLAEEYVALRLDAR